MPVNVHRHRPVTVDAPSYEIRKHGVRYREGAECKALRWCEADADEPVVETTITPLNTKPGAAVSTAMGRDRSAEVGRPPDVAVEDLGPLPWPSRPYRNREPSKPPKDSGGRATEPRGDLVDRESLIDVKSSQQSGFNGHVWSARPGGLSGRRRIQTSSVAPTDARSMPHIRYACRSRARRPTPAAANVLPRGVDGHSPTRGAPILR